MMTPGGGRFGRIHWDDFGRIAGGVRARGVGRGTALFLGWPLASVLGLGGFSHQDLRRKGGGGKIGGPLFAKRAERRQRRKLWGEGKGGKRSVRAGQHLVVTACNMDLRPGGKEGCELKGVKKVVSERWLPKVKA